MKLSIPKTASLSNEVLRERFFKRYYPELSAKDVWTIWGTHARLQKNPFVCALFQVQHQAHQTDIVMKKGTTRRAMCTDVFFLNYFIRGDFYTEVEKNLRKFLREEYHYMDKEIVKTPSWWSRHWRKIVMPIAILFGSWLLAVLYLTAVYSVDIHTFYPSAANSYPSDYELVELPGASRDSAYYDEYDDSATHQALRYKPTGEVLDGVSELPIAEYNGYAIVRKDYDYLFKAPSKPLQELDALEYGSYFTEDEMLVANSYHRYVLYNLEGEEVKAFIPTILPYLQNTMGAVVVFFLTLIISTLLYLRSRRKHKQVEQREDEKTSTLKL